LGIVWRQEIWQCEDERADRIRKRPDVFCDGIVSSPGEGVVRKGRRGKGSELGFEVEVGLIALGKKLSTTGQERYVRV